MQWKQRKLTLPGLLNGEESEGGKGQGKLWLLGKKEAYACTKEHKVNHRRTKKRKCLSGKKIMDKEKKFSDQTDDLHTAIASLTSL